MVHGVKFQLTVDVFISSSTAVMKAKRQKSCCKIGRHLGCLSESMLLGRRMRGSSVQKFAPVETDQKTAIAAGFFGSQ